MPREFIYVGKDESSPDQITVRGLTFELNGEPVPVSDEALAKGLSGNPEFEEVGGGPDYGDVADDLDPETIISAFQARVEDLLAVNADQAAEIRELKERLGQKAPEVPAQPEKTDYPVDKIATTLAEIDEHEDWSKAHHSTRIKWANALTEGQVANKEEADDIILAALVDREQDQD